MNDEPLFGIKNSKLSCLFDRDSHMTSNVLRFISNRLGSDVMHSWFNNTVIKFDKDGLPIIYFSNQFVHDWVLNHYRETLEDALQATFKTRLFKTSISNQVTTSKENGFITDNSLQLDNEMRFCTFVVGKANEMAFEAARRITTKTKEIFNPLFIHGPSGVGKTHLMQAIAWQAKEAGWRVCYISSEQYMMNFFKSIRAGNYAVLDFKDSFSNIDIICIEDIQFMNSKGSTQEEIFHTFARLMSSKIQIVVSADQKPSELSGIEKKIKSRLGGGLTVCMQVPSFDLRLQILKQKTKQYNKSIDNSILEMLANKVQNSIRELEGALHRICAQMDFFGKEMSFEAASSALQEMLNSPQKKVSVDLIIDVVCDFYKVSKFALMSNTRVKEIVRARQIAILFCRDILKKSLPEIGKIFGGKDHTTALYAIRTMRKKIAKDPCISSDVEKIKLVLYS